MFQLHKRLRLNYIKLVTSNTLIIARILTKYLWVFPAETMETEYMIYSITIQFLKLTNQLWTFTMRTHTTIPWQIRSTTNRFTTFITTMPFWIHTYQCQIFSSSMNLKTNMNQSKILSTMTIIKATTSLLLVFITIYQLMKLNQLFRNTT